MNKVFTYIPYGKESRAWVKKLRLEGLSYDAIEKKTGIPKTTVGHWVRKWAAKNKAIAKVRLRPGPKAKRGNR